MTNKRKRQRIRNMERRNVHNVENQELRTELRQAYERVRKLFGLPILHMQSLSGSLGKPMIKAEHTELFERLLEGR